MGGVDVSGHGASCSREVGGVRDVSCYGASLAQLGEHLLQS